MNVLVSAASRHGSTWEIAEAIAEGLKRRDIAAVAMPAEEVGDLGAYDAFVIGSAVYYGHWLEAARELVGANADALAEPPVWLFSSGPLGDPDHRLPEDDALDVSAQLDAAKPVAHRIFAGKLDKGALKFRERAVVAALKAPEGDFRDWDAIDAYAAEIAGQLA